ncbi:MAG: glycosyltransferase family 39 protein, partial [Chloroflexi bacterium]|nr:glycosyltransferase family 39 protein [Chloroflexota bacterium]
MLAYQPGLRVGFFNGWWYLEWVSSMSLPRYLVQFFDPRNVTQGYRPVQGLFVLLEYTLFKFNSDGWLLSQILLHAANGVLLFLIVERVGKRWRLALVAALFYVVSPVFNLAVFWHAVVDPLSAFFYLLTILLWVRYLESRRAWDWAAAFGAFVLALFSKEVAVFLPLILFLIEWLLYERPLEWLRLARQYVPFLLPMVPFAMLDLNVQSHGEFVGQFGFKVGPHMIANLFPYLAVLTFPWLTDKPADAVLFIWMAVALAAYVAIMVFKRSRVLLLLGIFAVLNIGPLLGFPLEYFNTRYLYTSMIAPAVVFALLVDLGLRHFSWRAAGVAAAVVVAALVVASGARVADAASGLAEYTRVLRVPFRDITREHPAFPPDTYLYFAYPITPVSELQGLFYVRYFGSSVTVDGTDTGHPAELSSHNASYVYYFDST